MSGKLDIEWDNPSPPREPKSIAGEAGITIGTMGAGVNEGISQILNLPSDAIAGVMRLVAMSAENPQTAGPGGPQPGTAKVLRDAANWVDKNFDVRNSFKMFGIPVGGTEAMKKEGVEMTPLRETLNRAGQTVGSTLAVGAGPVASTIAGVGAAAGREIGKEVGEFAGDKEGGAQVGETIGSVAAPMTALSLSRMTGRPPKPPEKVELEKAKDAAYKRADDAGVMFSPQGLNDLATKVATDMARMDLYPALHRNAATAMGRIVDEAATGAGASMTKMDKLRQTVRDAMSADGTTESQRRLIRRMVNDIDDFVAHPPPGAVTFGDVVNGPLALKEARGLARKEFNAEMIDDLVTRARDSASTYLAGGFQTALKNEFRHIVKDKDAMRMFSPDEQDALRKIVRGSTVENVLRHVGRMAPQNIFNAAAVYGAVTATTNPVVGGAVLGTGLAARAISSGMTKGNVRETSELMRRGSLPDPQTLSPLERQLLRTVLGRAAQEAQQ